MAKKKRRPVKKVQDASPLSREIIFLVIIIFSILLLLSQFDLCGAVGKLLSGLLFGLFGAASYVFPVGLLIASGLFISNPENKELKRKIIYSSALYLCICGLFQWVIDSKADGLIEIYKVCSSERIGGGLLGGILSYLLTLLAGRAGSFVIILGLTLLFVMLITRKLIFAAIRELYEEKRAASGEYVEYEAYEEDETNASERQMKVHTFDKKKAAKKKKDEKKKEIPNISIIRNDTPVSEEPPVYQEELETKFGGKKKKAVAEESNTNTEPPQTTEKSPKTPAKKAKTDSGQLEKETAQIQAEIQKTPAKPEQKESTYVFPSLELLSKPKSGGKGLSDTDLLETAAKLQDTLESFGVRVKMGDVSCGPSVTRYELVPEQGVKVSSITRLADDIKLSLAASDIRIEAPIPGKAAVGIEVPNAKRNMVTLRELLESKEFQSAKSKVSFAVGKDISGKTIVTDIAKMPHMLVAGATGSGKSVCINTLIMSILYKADPDEVKFIMVDPKMVELTAYADIPHLMIPVVTDPKKASAALNWAVQEMTVRYNKFAELGVRDIKSYNKKIKGLKHNEENTYERMCQIVIIVDEFADLMMVAPGEVEDAVCRLAQLARAAGIHLVLATQRPSVNVITGLIKANIPSRIALSVSSAIDSRTIIDSAGAEKLLGNGDMLFAPQDYPKPVRIQGAFVSDEERDGVVAFLKQQQPGPSYNEEVTKHINANPVGTKAGAAGSAPGGNEQDELFVEVGRFIIEKDKASIGMLQRVFRIGFNRAARIMDQLCEAGVVGPEEGTKPRTILMSMEQFENYLENGENGGEA
ncbi:MAG: DNA translocase FtsK [Roseburia sp.]|nr:DNA translocase FtsK [Roseburia sp.]